MIGAQRAATAAIAAKRASAGALVGLLCWLIFAAVEVLLTATRVLASPSAAVRFTAESWAATFELLSLLAAFGSMMGSAIALGRGPIRPSAAAGPTERLAVNLTLAVAVFVAAALSGTYGAPAISAMALSAAAAGCIVARRQVGISCSVLANPLCMSIVLAGAPYLLFSLSAGWRPWSTFAALAALGAAAIAADRWVLTAANGEWPLPRFAFAAAVFVALVMGSVRVLNSIPATPRNVAAPQQKRPNVVLIVWDTVRADHLSPYGYERDTTPFLSSLGRRSTLYRNAQAVSDMTLPAHGSMFTGMYPAWHGAYVSTRDARARPLAADVPTLAEILSEAGFATAAVAANVGYVSREMGMDRGFDTFHSLTEAQIFEPAFAHLPRTLLRPLVSVGRANYHFEASTLTAGAVNEIAFSLLEDSAEDGNEFFLFLNYMDAHGPYRPPPPYLDRFPGRLPGHRSENFHALLQDAIAGRRKPTSRERRHLTALYDGALAYLDSELARLVERLEGLGLLDNTLLILTSDHGELLGEKGLLDHAVGLHHPLLHVPLMVKYPGNDSAVVVDREVSQVDLLPTVLDTLGISSRLGLHGESLRRNGRNPGVFSMHSPSQTVMRANPAFRREELSLFRSPWKAVQTAGEATRVYNLALDPKEDRDLFDAGDDAVRRLASDLESWMESRPTGEDPAPAVSPVHESRLRSLGYLH